MGLVSQFSLSDIFKGLKSFIFTILLFVYLCLIAFYPNDFAFSGTILLSIISLMFFTALIAKIRYSFLLNIPFVFFVCLSAFFSFMYSSWVWTESLLAILRTNAGEASEMGKSFVLPGLLIIIVTTSIILLSQRELKQAKYPSWKISLFVVCLYSFLLLPFLVNRIIERIEFRSVSDSSVMNAQYTNMYAPIFYGNIVSSYAAVVELYKMKDLLKNIENKDNPDGILYSDSLSAVKRVIIVMGESSNRNHYSLFGYDRSTTPFLDSLKNRESVFMNYYDAISPAPSTVLSLFRSLSFATIDNASAAYNLKSIVDLANDAGYNTFWISNQDPIGESNSEIGLIALGANNQKYLEKHNSKGDADINIVDELSAIYSRDEKQLIVLHLMGSHIYYSARIDDVDRNAIADSDRNTNAYNSVDDYDRSIHHTDRVLAGIFKVMEADKNSAMLYVSDHGEIVGLGHGYMKDFKDQYEIPLITYNFSKLNVDSIVTRYTDRNKIFNTVNLSYILSEMIGYTVSDELKDEAVSKSSHILLQSGEVVDFDTVKDK